MGAVAETNASAKAERGAHAPPGTQADRTASPIETTCDAFLGGALHIKQPRRGYRAGTDAVLLAASFDPATKHTGRPMRVADVGAGVGTVGLCLAARHPNLTIDLIEREPLLIDLMHQNVEASVGSQHLRALACDVLGPDAKTTLPDCHYDHVLANPPFFAASKVRRPRDDLRAASHVQDDEDLARWVKCFARIVKPSGTITMIYPADGLSDLLAAVTPRFGAINIAAIHPRPGRAAIRVLVRATRGSRAPLAIAPPIFLHEAEGHQFTPAIAEVLKTPRHLCVWPV